MNTKKMPYGSHELRDMYNDLNSGHFFNPDTMRFFKSRLTSQYRRLDDNTALFITTEKGPLPTSKRLATVRIARLVIDGYRGNDTDWPKYRIKINTLGEFNRLSMYYAKKFMAEYKKEE